MKIGTYLKKCFFVGFYLLVLWWLNDNIVVYYVLKSFAYNISKNRYLPKFIEK